MRSLSLLSLATAVSTASAQAIQGFNYGSTYSDGSAIDQTGYQNLFNTAKGLVGHSGFSSARIYTLVQGGTQDTPSEAIPAAINTGTTLLLGLWASGGQADFTNELNALSAAINTYGQDFANAVVGISVGSEDLYRISPTGIENMSGAGADPDTLVSYISQLRSAISGTVMAGKSVGHVDTWTAWVNSSNDAVIEAVDWLGMDAYPYFQTTEYNDISVGNQTFFEAYYNTTDSSMGKPVWVTETGWPVSGPQENAAVPSLANAKTYWDDVACTLLGNINTWWYTLQDAAPTTPSPSFGLVGSTLSTTPLYDLTCPAGSSGGSSSQSSSSSAAPPPSSSASAITTGTTGSPTSLATMPHSETVTGGTGSSSSASATGGSGSSPSGGTTVWVTYTTTVCPVSTMTWTSGTNTYTTVTTITSSIAVTTTTSMAASSSMATSATSAPASCPTDLSGDYQFPHLIVPVSQSHPDTAYGTQYNGTFSSDISSIFNFDFPYSYQGKVCQLLFLFPLQSSLVTSSFTLSGTGGISVDQLASPATTSTTYDSCPAVAAPLGSASSVTPGNSYTLGQIPCPAGSAAGFKVSATGSLSLSYFQDYNQSPIGMYIVPC